MKTRKIYQVGWTDFRGDVPQGGELQTFSRREADAFRKAKRAAGADVSKVTVREAF